MKRNFTRMMNVCFGITFLCSPLMGQIERTVIVREAPGAELRAEETAWWPDSTVRYTGTGEKISKAVYDEASRQVTDYRWENNAWISDDGMRESQGYYFLNFAPSYRNEGAKGILSYCMVASGLGVHSFNLPGGSTSTVNDANGNLISVVIKDLYGRDCYTFSFKYNDKNNPVSIEWNFYDSPYWKASYQYNANGYAVLFESFRYDEQNSVWINESRVTLKFDTQDRPDLMEAYEGENNKWVLDEYTRFYYGTSSGNESVSAVRPLVYAANHTLYIEIAQAEVITVYSISGAKLYKSRIQAGTSTIDATRFPQGVLIVKGNGWVRKIRN